MAYDKTKWLKIGIKNLMIAPEKENEPGKYEEWVPEEGITELSFEYTGEDSNFYADDKVYWVVSSTSGKSYTLSLAALSEWFQKTILGRNVDETTGIMEETDADTYRKFAMSYEITTTGGVGIKHIDYGCLPSKPTSTATTKGESAEVQTESITVTSTGVQANGKNYFGLTTTSETPQTVHDKWFTGTPIMPGEYTALVGE